VAGFYIAGDGIPAGEGLAMLAVADKDQRAESLPRTRWCKPACAACHPAVAGD